MASYEEIIDSDGFLIVSPTTGSMRPMLREKRDSVLLEPFDPLSREIRRGDVLLFHRGDKIVLHRAIRPFEGGWYTRGDSVEYGEYTPWDQVIAIMRGFYRGERYVSINSLPYRLYAILASLAHPLIPFTRKAKRTLKRILCRKRTESL